MRDHLSDELVSAYIDGELAGDERQLVERMLTESDEHRELYQELRRLHASFQELPKVRLAADFHRRVIAKVERAQATTGKPQTAHASKSSKSKTIWWQTALAVAAIAAAVVLAVFLNRRPNDPNLVVEKSPVRELFAPAESWYDEQFVYYQRPSQRMPTITTIVDLVVTPEGQANFAFQNAFRQAGVRFDTEMAIDQSLEESLLASRIAANLQPVGKGDEHDSVVLYYVVCESDKANDILNYFRGRPHEAMAQMGFAYNSPELEMLYQLNRSSVAQFASAESGKEKRSLVHRLVFSIRLRSVTLPALLAAGLDGSAEANAEPPRTVRTPHLARLETAPTELLFVVRNLKEPTEQ